MSVKTDIQWTDSTVNPVMGCDGCELWPTIRQLQKQFASALRSEFPKVDDTNARAIARASMGDITITSHLWQRRAEVVENAIEAVSAACDKDVLDKNKQRLAASLAPTCYAGVLHTRYGEDPRNPDKGINTGFARVFESPKRFPGRMAAAAKWPDLHGTQRVDSPWKNGLPRTIFVSDMGDALSSQITFNYLLGEIIEPVSSEKGSRHVWQWLTKRPQRMGEFAGWLKGQGISWPQNLVAMTSVTSAKTAGRVAQLRKIPAILGLSVEPLWEPVKLDLQGIDWVICGGASGTGAKPFDLAWARNLREQCRTAGVAFFLKQMGANPVENGSPLKLKHNHGGDWLEWPTDLMVREFPKAFYALGSSSIH